MRRHDQLRTQPVSGRRTTRRHVDMTVIPSPRAGLWWGRPISELRWQLEWAALLADPVWRGVGVPRGDGSPVLLVPGFLSGDVSLRSLRTWLQRIGYRTYRADIRWNVDCADRAMVRLERRVTTVVQRTGQPVRVLGHSRGGLFARALVHRCPEDLTEVITLGSPLANELDCSCPPWRRSPGLAPCNVCSGRKRAGTAASPETAGARTPPTYALPCLRRYRSPRSTPGTTESSARRPVDQRTPSASRSAEATWDWESTPTCTATSDGSWPGGAHRPSRS